MAWASPLTPLCQGIMMPSAECSEHLCLGIVTWPITWLRGLSTNSLTYLLLRVPRPGSPPIQSRRYINCPPTPWLACVWGMYSNPHHARLFSYAPSQISLSSMGPSPCTGMGAVSMKVKCLQGAPPQLHTQTSYAGTRALVWRRARIALYNRLFSRSIITHCRGMRSVSLPLGKGWVALSLLLRIS